MNPIKKIVSSLLILFLLSTYTSCLDDEFKGCQEEECTSFDLTIALPKPTLKETRSDISSRTDFTDLSSLHVIVYPVDTLNNEPLINYYNEEDFPGKKMLTAGEQLTLTVNYTATFGDISKVYLVGNYEKDSINPQKNQYPSSVRGIKVEIDDNNFIPKCIYFGEAQKQPGNTTGPCGLYKAELKRPFAMVSINMEADKLDPSISIRPIKISIHNYAVSCKIGEKNSAKVGTDISDKDYSFYTDWGTLSSNNPYIGGKGPNNIDEGQVFYVLENLQDSTKNTDQTKKDLQERKYATYIKVRAEFVQYDTNTNKIKVTGEINYQFCLGENVTNKYSVERDHHYDVTLVLTEFAGAGEDAHVDGSGNVKVEKSNGISWRVDLTTTDNGFQTIEKNFNARGETGKIKVAGVVIDPGVGFNKLGIQEDWVFIRIGSSWQPINEINLTTAVAQGEINYYIKPWRANASGNFYDPITQYPYRRCFISGMTGAGGAAQNIVLNQWAPIKLPDTGVPDPEGTLYMDRFENVNTYAEWGSITNLSDTLPLSSCIENFNTFIFGTDADGLNNTAYLYKKLSSPNNASKVIETTGYNEATGIPSLFGKDRTAMYYIPNSEELKRMMEYVSIINNNPETKHDPINKNADYWSSSVLKDDKNATLYWNGSKKNIESTTDRNSPKRVRYVYRPSKDLN